MDPLFMACSLYRRRKFEECSKICTEILEKNPYDQVKLIYIKKKLKLQYFLLILVSLGVKNESLNRTSLYRRS